MRPKLRLRQYFSRPPGPNTSEENAVLSQASFICGFGAGRPGVGSTLVAHPRRSIPRALVAGLGTLNYGCED